MLEIVEFILSFCLIIFGSSALIAWFFYLDISDHKKKLCKDPYQKKNDSQKNNLKPLK